MLGSKQNLLKEHSAQVYIKIIGEKESLSELIPAEWMGDIQHNGKKIALYDKAQI